MVIQCLDLLLGCLACVVLHELILICVVLVLFMLTTIKSFFVFSLFWLIKLILVHVNFVTGSTGRRWVIHARTPITTAPARPVAHPEEVAALRLGRVGPCPHLRGHPQPPTHALCRRQLINIIFLSTTGRRN
jgi:hypothetical protein